MYLCYDVDMWSIYGMDIRLLKEHPEYKEQIKLLPTRWEKVNKIKKEGDRLRSIAAGILLSYGLRENGIDLDACQLIMASRRWQAVRDCILICLTQETMQWRYFLMHRLELTSNTEEH